MNFQYNTLDSSIKVYIETKRTIDKYIRLCKHVSYFVCNATLQTNAIFARTEEILIRQKTIKQQGKCPEKNTKRYYRLRRRLNSRHFPFVVEDHQWNRRSRMYSQKFLLYIFLFHFLVCVFYSSALFVIWLYIRRLSSYDFAVLCRGIVL